MIITDNYLHQLTDDERESVVKLFSELLFHLDNMVKLLWCVQSNHYLTEIYSDVVSTLFSEYGSIFKNVKDCKPEGTVEVVIPNLRKKVEEMLLRKYNIDYNMLPKTRIAGVATSNGNFEIREG